MTFEELIGAVQMVVFDQRYTEDIIRSRINESVARIAKGVKLAGQERLSPPLPDLYTTGTVDTVLASDITDLPTNFSRSLIQVLNSNSDIIDLEPSMKKFLQDNPEQSAGDVRACCVIGNRLMYRDVPSAIETLTVGYYKKPDTLAANDDTPSAIPEHLHRSLIVGDTLKEIFREIERGMAGPKHETEYYTGVFYAGLNELDELFPYDALPVYISDEEERID